MEGLEELIEGLGEGDNTGVVEAAEEFLELGEGSEDGKTLAVDPGGGFGGDEI